MGLVEAAIEGYSIKQLSKQEINLFLSTSILL
jgi:hypothetical protein